MNTDNTANNIPIEYSNLTLNELLKKCEDLLNKLQDLADDITMLQSQIEQYLDEEEN
jgi:prefoldin subunit 5